MRILPILFTAALLAPLAIAQGAGDVIIKKDGSRVRGVEVNEFLLTGVRGKRGSEDFEVPAHQVANIEWGGEPDAFAAGRSAVNALTMLMRAARRSMVCLRRSSLLYDAWVMRRASSPG